MKRSRLRRHVFSIMFFVVFVLVLMAGMGPTLGTTRMKFSSIQTSGDKVVAAVESYQRDQGGLPANLNVLVPEYLPRLDNVAFARKMAYNYPQKFLDHDIKSPWVYKLSHDKANFALAVKDNPRFFYDSRSFRWRMGEEGFASYEKLGGRAHLSERGWRVIVTTSCACGLARG